MNENNSKNKGFSSFCVKLLWLSTFFALSSLVPVYNLNSGLSLLIVFVLVTKAIPYRIWNKYYKILLFFGLLTLIGFQADVLSKKMGTLFLMVILIVNSLNIKDKRSIQTMVIFNIIVPFLAFLQIQSPLSSICGFLSIVLSLLVLIILNTNENYKNKHFLKSVFPILFQFSLILPIVFVLYVFTPRINNPWFGNFTNSKTKTGISDEMNISRWTKLFKDYSPAFEVHFNGKVPLNNYLYFKGITLWTFKGKKWIKTPSIPWVNEKYDKNKKKIDKNNIYSYSIINKNYQSNRLFIWGNVISSDPNFRIKNGGQSYFNDKANQKIKIISTNQNIQKKDENKKLSLLKRINATQLPKNINPKTIAFAKKLRKNSKNNKDYIKKVLNFFHNSNFYYSMSPPSLGNKNYIDHFLFNTKTGFCVHYASSFAVLMRAVGIPTKIMNGYVVKNPHKFNASIIVRQSSAHAWDKVWINDKWTLIDPTAQVSSRALNNNETSQTFFGFFHTINYWVSHQWSKWFVYYDNNQRVNITTSIKQWFKSINFNFNNINKPLYIIIILIVASFLIIFFIINKKSIKKIDNKEKLIKNINKWFDSFGLFKTNLTWNAKKKKISPLLSTTQNKMLTKALRNAEEYLYGKNDNLSYKEIWYNFKKIKKQKVSKIHEKCVKKRE